MAAKSFIEILEARIRKDLIEELREDFHREDRQFAASSSKQGSAGFDDPSGRLGVWLATHINKTEFNRAVQARKSYASSRSSRQNYKTQSHSTQERTSQAHGFAEQKNEARVSRLTIEESCALELISRYSGTALRDDFSPSELKTAWRKAALRTHPDRFAQADLETQRKMADIFTSLLSAYEILEAAFQASQAQSAKAS